MLVKDRMTPNPITITPDSSFSEAFHILEENEIRHLPVVDGEGRLVGIVAQTDLLHASPSMAVPSNVFEMSYLLANLHIRDVMTSPPITVLEDVPLEEAARIMVEQKISCLPVMRNGTLVGIITKIDIFETFVEILGGWEASLRSTVRIPDGQGELARLAGVIANLGANICSVARFKSQNPEYVFVTFRTKGVDETLLVPALEAETEVVHVCCAVWPDS